MPRCRNGVNNLNAGTCFRKGLGVGYFLAKNTYPPLESLTLRELGDYARRLGIPRYSRLNKDGLINALRQVYPPRRNQ